MNLIKFSTQIASERPQTCFLPHFFLPLYFFLYSNRCHTNQGLLDSKGKKGTYVKENRAKIKITF